MYCLKSSNNKHWHSMGPPASFRNFWSFYVDSSKSSMILLLSYTARSFRIFISVATDQTAPRISTSCHEIYFGWEQGSSRDVFLYEAYPDPMFALSRFTSNWRETILFGVACLSNSGKVRHRTCSGDVINVYITHFPSIKRIYPPLKRWNFNYP